jgi:hypothetical protein
MEVEEMAAIRIPDIEIPEGAANVLRAIEDGAYIAIGLALLVFQRAQVHRVELQKQVEAYLAATRAQAGPDEPAHGDEPTTRSQADTVAPDWRLDVTRAQLLAALRTFDVQVRPARQRFEDQADLLEAALPDQARALVKIFRDVARRSEQELRSAVGLADAPSTAPAGDAPSAAAAGDAPGTAPAGDAPGTAPAGEGPGTAAAGDAPGTAAAGDAPGTAPAGEAPPAAAGADHEGTSVDGPSTSEFPPVSGSEQDEPPA